MSRHYDVVVVGSGAAASGVASRVRRAGRSVALIDCRAFGGTCALRGCDPKKVLVGGAEAVRAARRLEHRGVCGRPAIDWPELIAFERTFTDLVPARREQGYREAGIDAFQGTARFTDDHTLETRHILGAHLLGPGAEDTINLFALAIRENLTTDALRDAFFAYPTAASDIGYML